MGYPGPGGQRQEVRAGLPGAGRPTPGNAGWAGWVPLPAAAAEKFMIVKDF